MLLNYLKTAVRNLLRQRLYALANVVGLAVGMTCCILVMLYVRHELSYDTRHPHAKQLYRVVSDESARHAQPLGPMLKQHMGEVAEVARIRQPLQPLISVDEVQQYRHVMFADATLFRLFEMPFLEGDPATALQAPRSMVLTTDVADIYFPEGDALGKTILWDNHHPYTVTGVVEIPPDTHLSFEILASYSTLDTGAEFAGWPTDAWNPGGQGFRLVYTFVRLVTQEPPPDFGARAMALIERHFGEVRRDEVERRAGTPVLQPVADIHLNSTLLDEMSPGNRNSLVYGLGIIGVLILTIASINFVNLATARSTTRAREVGVRKAIGADRGRLIGQFLGESMLLSALAVTVAMISVSLALPAFGEIVGRRLSMDLRADPVMVSMPLLVLLICGILGGAYPAFALSGYLPVTVLRGGRAGAAGHLRLRRILVVIQFSAAVTLIIITSVVTNQLEYLRTKDLGFAGDQIVVARTAYEGVKERLAAMIPELERDPNIASASTADPLPMGSARSPGMTRIQRAEGAQIVESGIFLGSSGYVRPWAWISSPVVTSATSTRRTSRRPC
jgi:putative ABC transport system permease protein